MKTKAFVITDTDNGDKFVHIFYPDKDEATDGFFVGHTLRGLPKSLMDLCRGTEDIRTLDDWFDPIEFKENEILFPLEFILSRGEETI